MTFSHRGDVFAAIFGDGSIIVYDSVTGDCRKKLTPPADVPTPYWSGGLAFTANDATLVALIGAQLARYDLRAEQATPKLWRSHSAPHGVIRMSTEGKIIATASIDDRLRLWDRATLHLIMDKPCEGDYPCLAFDGGPSRVFVEMSSARVAVLDTRSGLQVALLRVGDSALDHLQFCSESDTLAVLDRRNSALHFWRAPSLDEIEATQSQ